MLLQTNSYIVPKDKRAQHQRLVQRFRQTLTRLGCDHFEAYEQVGANWSPADTTGRFVQLMRFRDRKHQLAVQGAERNDPTAQGLIKEFCELINFPYQQQQGLFAVGFYTSLLPSITPRSVSTGDSRGEPEPEEISEVPADEELHLEEAGAPPGELAARGPVLASLVDEPEHIGEIEEHHLTETHLSLVDEASGDEGLVDEFLGEEAKPAEADIDDTDALLDEMESSDEHRPPR